jgi:hypothetical protein
MKKPEQPVLRPGGGLVNLEAEAAKVLVFALRMLADAIAEEYCIVEDDKKPGRVSAKLLRRQMIECDLGNMHAVLHRENANEEWTLTLERCDATEIVTIAPDYLLNLMKWLTRIGIVDSIRMEPCDRCREMLGGHAPSGPCRRIEAGLSTCCKIDRA